MSEEKSVPAIWLILANSVGFVIGFLIVQFFVFATLGDSRHEETPLYVTFEKARLDSIYEDFRKTGIINLKAACEDPSSVDKLAMGKRSIDDLMTLQSARRIDTSVSLANVQSLTEIPWCDISRQVDNAIFYSK